MKNKSAKKRRITLADLRAGDPEAVKLWNEFVKETKPEWKKISEWYQEKEADPLTGPMIERLELKLNSKKLYERIESKYLSLESFVEMMNQLPEEARKDALEFEEKTPTVKNKEPYDFSLPHKRERDKIIWAMKEDGATDNHVHTELVNQKMRISISTIKENYKRMKKIREKTG